MNAIAVYQQYLACATNEKLKHEIKHGAVNSQLSERASVKPLGKTRHFWPLSPTQCHFTC